MLSNHLINAQRFVVIIDQIGQEKIAHNFVCQLLREQGQDEAYTKVLPLTGALREPPAFDSFICECACRADNNKWNVLLPTLADLLCFQRPAVIFDFLHKLRKSVQHVQRFFLWVSAQHLMQADSNYLIAACEYMADMVVYLETPTELAIITRKPGGGVTNKRFNYKTTRDECLVTPLNDASKKSPEKSEPPKPEDAAGTFKIDLEEDEMTARNAMKLPYEKTSETTEGNIIYTPDAEDDFDDEDPDEDLCI